MFTCGAAIYSPLLHQLSLLLQGSRGMRSRKDRRKIGVLGGRVSSLATPSVLLHHAVGAPCQVILVGWGATLWASLRAAFLRSRVLRRVVRWVLLQWGCPPSVFTERGGFYPCRQSAGCLFIYPALGMWCFFPGSLTEHNPPRSVNKPMFSTLRFTLWSLP